MDGLGKRLCRDSERSVADSLGQQLLDVLFNAS